MARWLFVGWLTILVAAAGCGGYRRGIHQVGNWGPVIVLEDGQQKSLYTRQISEYWGSPLFHDPSAARWSHILTEEKTRWITRGYDDSDTQRLWDSAPPWRREEKVEAVARRLTGDAPAELKRYVLSLRGPVVVGLSEDRADGVDGYRYLFRGWRGQAGTTQIPVLLTRFYISRTWPEPDERLGPVAEREVIELKPAMSLDQAIQSRPWEKNR